MERMADVVQGIGSRPIVLLPMVSYTPGGSKAEKRLALAVKRRTEGWKEHTLTGETLIRSTSAQKISSSTAWARKHNSFSFSLCLQRVSIYLRAKSHEHTQTPGSNGSHRSRSQPLSYSPTSRLRSNIASILCIPLTHKEPPNIPSSLSLPSITINTPPSY